jgi:maltooligosyltrehalose trehalohydrolase
MKRKHNMPFGAQVTDRGEVRFRLWAPKANTVALRMESSPAADLEMTGVEAGWFELTTSNACHGTRYQFVIDDLHAVPDPASRFQPDGVHAASEVIDPCRFQWRDLSWKGRPWDEAVIYELHVGTFSPEGTYAGVASKLDYLAELGVTAIELMPVASFPGARNWGYDGALPFAPAGPYGRPEDLKALIEAAHGKGLMVLLDVVYNHFGPEGNYLHLYAPQFFTDRHSTPWGEAINFEGDDGRLVRDYFIHNALYWLQEFQFDGLRLDAVHTIRDDSQPDILTELAETVREHIGGERHVHLILENDDNASHYLRRHGSKDTLYNAQWNDDIHHAAHVLLTGECDGYYADYASSPLEKLGRCLAEGFAYQGELSPFRGGRARGETSRDLPSTSFVSFLQNHDQIGNRALGKRITDLSDAATVEAMMVIFLLAPSPPLLFMGEEFAAMTPFLFFCDFGPDLAQKVTAGRRAEFTRFDQFRSPEAQSRIPDPNSQETFLRCKLNWSCLHQSMHRNFLDFYRKLLSYRRVKIIPRIKDIVPGKAKYELQENDMLNVQWPLASGGWLELLANFGSTTRPICTSPRQVIYWSAERPLKDGMPRLSVLWSLSG